MDLVDWNKWLFDLDEAKEKSRLIHRPI